MVGVPIIYNILLLFAPGAAYETRGSSTFHMDFSMEPAGLAIM